MLTIDFRAQLREEDRIAAHRHKNHPLLGAGVGSVGLGAGDYRYTTNDLTALGLLSTLYFLLKNGGSATDIAAIKAKLNALLTAGPVDQSIIEKIGNIGSITITTFDQAKISDLVTIVSEILKQHPISYKDAKEDREGEVFGVLMVAAMCVSAKVSLDVFGAGIFGDPSKLNDYTNFLAHYLGNLGLTNFDAFTIDTISAFKSDLAYHKDHPVIGQESNDFLSEFAAFRLGE